MPTKHERLRKVIPEGHPDECWEFKGKGISGYGYLFIDGKRILSHRLAFELEYGPIPEGMFICHSCDNPSCGNPEHLSIGNNADNLGDAAKKGRMFSGEARRALGRERALRGSGHPSTHLTDTDVLRIRKSVAKEEHTKAYFAELHNVSHRTIRDIVNRVTWTHIIPTTDELAPVKRELTTEEAQGIRTRLASGETQLSLAREYGMATTSMNRLARGIPGKYYGRS